jgi:hypothetical protein
MVTSAQVRKDLRPHGITAPACRSCYWFKDCGGFQSERSMETCFEATCCEFRGGNKALCNSVCPYKTDFTDWLSDTHGLSFDDLPSFNQPTLELPHYIPVIDHASRRRDPLAWPVVALNTSSVLRIGRRTGGQYRVVGESSSSIRRAFRIATDCRIFLNGVGKDKHLERYWENRLESEAPTQLARLRVEAAIGPNFSHFLGVPRTDNLFNRRRQLICLSEMQSSGLSVVPHLNAVMPDDWRFWRMLLAKNPTVRYVAIEFQTGNRTPRQGRRAIEHLVQIQTAINRPLHPIIVGGGQFVEYVASRFANFTLMDSMPFSKAMHRQYFDRSAGKTPWSQGFKLIGQDVDDFLLGNVQGYSALVKERIDAARRTTSPKEESPSSDAEGVAKNS